jgi:hypothetical protein
MSTKIVFKNLGGGTLSGTRLDSMAKFAIMGNEHVNNETVEILCQHIDDLRTLISTQDATIAALKNQKNP